MLHGRLISYAFNERTIATEELYRKLMLDKLEINKRILMKNLVAQMLRVADGKQHCSQNRTTLEETRFIASPIASLQQNAEDEAFVRTPYTPPPNNFHSCL